MSLLLNGLGVSRGIAIGKAHLLNRGHTEVAERQVPAHLVDSEVERYRSALHQANAQLQAIRAKVPEDARGEVAAFIDTKLLMLDDALLASEPVNIIRKRRCNAEWALKLQRDELIGVFEQMQDAYLRSRGQDVDQLINRIQRILLGEGPADATLAGGLRGYIVVADELTPADTLVLRHEGVAGFVTESGGPVSHTAILARSLRLPAAVGVHNARELLFEGEPLILNGANGMVLTDAGAAIARTYRRRQAEARERRRRLMALRDVPSVTRDGYVIEVHANIEVEEDIRALPRSGAAGVGLYRTEFLYLERETPANEVEQLETYRQVLRRLKRKPLTIRTLDLGADKPFDPAFARPLAPNPAMGLRAIRACLQDIGLFMPQLRAILRASAHGPVRLLFPMVSGIGELAQVLELLARARRELTRERLAFDPHMPVGIMVEVPAAALAALSLAHKLDFLSIGTNDLIQYTLAIDRIDEQVSYLYDPLHPAVLKLIAMVLQAGQRARVPVAMCGEMAGDPRFTRLLLGMGLRELSVHPSAVLEVKQIVTDSDAGALARRTKPILAAHEPERIAALVDALNP